jgi:hypothetical protein
MVKKIKTQACEDEDLLDECKKEVQCAKEAVIKQQNANQFLD